MVFIYLNIFKIYSQSVLCSLLCRIRSKCSFFFKKIYFSWMQTTLTIVKKPNSTREKKPSLYWSVFNFLSSFIQTALFKKFNKFNFLGSKTFSPNYFLCVNGDKIIKTLEHSISFVLSRVKIRFLNYDCSLSGSYSRGIVFHLKLQVGSILLIFN